MATFQIEGDLNGLREEQLQFIRDVLEKRGFKNNKVIFEPAGKDGDNYIANVKRIRVVAEDGNDFMMIAKIASQNEALRTRMNTAMMFNNEIMMYEQVLPKFVSLQKAAFVPEEEWLKYAECYGCSSEQPNEVILLEDLKEANMTMLDRYSSLSDEAVRIILKNFAVLHSLSFALKKLEPATYDSFRTKLMDTFDKDMPEFDTFLAQVEDAAVSVVDDAYKKNIRGLVSKNKDITKKLKKSDRHLKHLIIQQGDSWTNNIMFKLKDDRPTECIMIDYQLSKECNPVTDILFMIFTSTDHATRSKYYLDWIDYYHNELDRSLSNFGIKANSVYPKDQLDADLKRYSKQFFGFIVVVFTIISRTSEEAVEIKDTMQNFNPDVAVETEFTFTMNNLSKSTINFYKSRVEGMIDSYYLFGYF